VLQCRYASRRERVGAPNMCVCCSVLQCVVVDCRGCCSVVVQVGKKELALLMCVCAAVCFSVLQWIVEGVTVSLCKSARKSWRA